MSTNVTKLAKYILSVAFWTINHNKQEICKHGFKMVINMYININFKKINIFETIKLKILSLKRMALWHSGIGPHLPSEINSPFLLSQINLKQVICTVLSINNTWVIGIRATFNTINNAIWF